MLQRLKDRIAHRFGPLHRRLATRHLHGPTHVNLAPDQVMLVALLRDAAWFLDVFLDHHYALGVTHVLVIDNGSTDATLEMCRRRDRLTLVQNLLPAKRHESGLRAELAQRVARGGWILFADADELIETHAPLGHLTGWCNAQGATAVLGQMLDRFGLAPYAALKDLDYRASVAALDHYSLTGVEALDYHDADAVPFHWFLRDNLCDAPKGRFKQGGIRAALFGEKPFLSKHSLVRNLPGVVPMSHPHCASDVRVADVDLLIHHYKLAGDWVARDARSVAAAYWAHGEDAKRLAAIGQGGDFRLTPAAAQVWTGLRPLQDAGFLKASDVFLAGS